MEVSRLRERNVIIDRQNFVLRQMRQKQRGRKLKKYQINKNGSTITNRKAHRPTVPAKLRYRRQRTTHRTVLNHGRSW